MFGFASTRASNKGKFAVVVMFHIVEMTNLLQVTVANRALIFDLSDNNKYLVKDF